MCYNNVFNCADLRVQITYLRKRNDNVIILGESKGRSSVFINIWWTCCLLRYEYINIYLNWEQLTMKLRSIFVCKRIVAWRTIDDRWEWSIKLPTCVGAMNHKMLAQNGWKEGEELHDVVTRYSLCHKSILKNSSSVLQIYHSCILLGQFRVLTCCLCFMVGGRYVW